MERKVEPYRLPQVMNNRIKDKPVSLIMPPQPITFYSITTLPDGSRDLRYHTKYYEWIMPDIWGEMQLQYSGIEKPKAVLLSFPKVQKE